MTSEERAAIEAKLEKYAKNRSIKEIYYDMYRLDQLPKTSNIEFINTFLSIVNSEMFRLVRNIVTVVTSSI